MINILNYYGDVLRFFEKIVAYIQILFKNFIIN